MLEIKELEKRTIDILEKTKKQSERYKVERKTLYQFSIEKNIDMKEWEEYLHYFEELIK